MIAAEKGHSKVVNLLVEAGAQMDTQDKDDKTFFHIAAAAGHPHIIKVIFQQSVIIVILVNVANIFSLLSGTTPTLCSCSTTMTSLTTRPCTSPPRRARPRRCGSY